MAYEIAYYDAILLLVGKENFNMIFGGNKEYDNYTGPTHP
jgi:hypothetical protein